MGEPTVKAQLAIGLIGLIFRPRVNIQATILIQPFTIITLLRIAPY